jgi:hypothetical protein
LDDVPRDARLAGPPRQSTRLRDAYTTMTRKLQITLYLIAAYLAAFGILFLVAPSIAERITGSTHDPTLNLLYGQYTLTFAYVSFMAARENDAASRLSRTILILTAGHAVVFGYLLVAGMQAVSRAGPPLVVNAILMILLFVFTRRRSRSGSIG